MPRPIATIASARERVDCLLRFLEDFVWSNAQYGWLGRFHFFHLGGPALCLVAPVGPYLDGRQPGSIAGKRYISDKLAPGTSAG